MLLLLIENNNSWHLLRICCVLSLVLNVQQAIPHLNLPITHKEITVLLGSPCADRKLGPPRVMELA